MTSLTGKILLAVIEFELTAPTAVGAPERMEGEVATVRPVVRDGWDEPWIPPSSLAGSFRDHLPTDLATVLMGNEPQRTGRSPDDHSSVVRFLGTTLKLPKEVANPVRQRTQTAINPWSGAARSSTLRRTEHLPPGTRLWCYLRVDGAEHHHQVEQALSTWHPVIGAGRTTGQGTVRPVSARCATVDLDTPEGRRLWLTHGGPELLDAANPRLLPLTASAAPEPLLPPTRWRIVDALHIGVGPAEAGKAAEILRDHQGRPYVPGTTWKGLLRSRASYILRSVGVPACQVEGCGNCGPCAAFGWSGKEAEGARGILRFPDTLIEGDKVPQPRQHVAIDRFTGGATDGLLFKQKVVEQGEVELALFSDGEIDDTVHAALVLALWDLHCGLLGVGGGVTRGQGTLRCTNPALLESLCADARKVLACVKPG